MRNGYGVLALTASAYWRGVGEAGGTPPSQSLLADTSSGKASLCSRHSGDSPQYWHLGWLFGGAVIAEAYGWRTVFLVFGIPGVLLAALIQLTVKEPPKLKAASESSIRACLAP